MKWKDNPQNVREHLKMLYLRNLCLEHIKKLVQLLNHVWIFGTPWTLALQAPLSSTNSQSFLNSMCIESLMLFNHLILCFPLFLLPSIFPSIRVFFNDSALNISWSKYWIFTFSNSTSSEYSGLFAFRIDWFDLLAFETISIFFTGTAFWKFQFFRHIWQYITLTQERLDIFFKENWRCQGNIYIPFPIWNQFVDPCPVLTVALWSAYVFLMRQVRWSGIFISLRNFHSLL